RALKLSPDSPDLLQYRAEIAIRQKDFAKAGALARKSWALGPKLGSLCARNWQTIVEIRLQARDLAGATAARKLVEECHKPEVTRY
ncbi:MAG: tetratricopeptide repeat protein, partial [Rhodanobacter sp.]